MLTTFSELSQYGRRLSWAVMCTVAMTAGCSSEQPAPTLPEGPLTIAEWKELPIEIKFEEEGLKRLREGTPELQDDAAFQKFQETTLKEELKKDAPLKPSGSY